MSFASTTQANRTAIRLNVQKLYSATQDTGNGRNLRGIRNDYSDAQVDAIIQALANAIKAAGYTAV